MIRALVYGIAAAAGAVAALAAGCVAVACSARDAFDVELDAPAGPALVPAPRRSA